MLRASSGKHAQFVKGGAAGSDSVSAAPRDLLFLLSLDRRLDVSTSGKFAWFVVLR